MRNTEEEIELNEIDFSYYNVPLHFFELWVLLIITTIISAFSIPWLFKLLDFIIHSLWSSVKLFPVLEEGSSLIPNFLAGMLGIIIGFIFDAIYIRRMKILYDYIGIRDCIKEDLKEIVHVCIYSKGKINAAQEEMLKSKVSKYSGCNASANLSGDLANPYDFECYFTHHVFVAIEQILNEINYEEINRYAKYILDKV